MSETNISSNEDRELSCSSAIEDNGFERKTYFEKPEVLNKKVSIFLNRLIEIFEILMTKLEFAATLPLILVNPKLSEVLNRDDLTQIHCTFISSALCQNISNQSQSGESISSGIVTTTNNEDTNGYTESIKFNTSCRFVKEDIDIYNAIQILRSKKCINDLSKENQNNISKSTYNFLQQIKYFMNFMISKIKLLPSEEREKELHLRQLCIDLEKTKLDFYELINSLEKQKSRHTSELKALSDKVLRSKEEWDEIQENFQNQIAETMKNSKANIAKCTAHYSKKINYHQQTLDNFKALVESEKKSNRRVENELQGKKFKVESQLLSLIMKFDAEVIEKQEIYDELMAEYEVVQEEKSILTDEMDEQLLIYESIMADKQEKEQAIFNEKFNKFIRNRCAKVIQRWWRRIIEKINAAKKKKKRKGKK